MFLDSNTLYLPQPPGPLLGHHTCGRLLLFPVTGHLLIKRWGSSELCSSSWGT